MTKFTISFLLILQQALLSVVAKPHQLPSLHKIYQFPNETWVENIAVRRNGNLLVSLALQPDLYEIDPRETPAVPRHIFTFPHAISAWGIEEIEPDVFAVAAGNFSVLDHTKTGGFGVWKVDLQGHKQAATVSHVASIKGASLLNGLTTTGKGRKTLLMSDSIRGVIWGLDISSGRSSIVMNQTELRPNKPIAAGGFGVNGIRAQDGFLYFTNTNLGFFRVPIDSGGRPTGCVEQLSAATAGDDFALDSDGTAFIARGAADVIERVTTDGKSEVVRFRNADSKALLEGNTSARFGRSKKGDKVLYIVTNGGIIEPVQGIPVHGGTVLSVDLGSRRG